MFKKLSMFGNSGSTQNAANNQNNAVLRVIGDRASGKTTYMAALASWPNAEPSSPVESVTAFNDDGTALIDKAEVLLKQGLPLEPSTKETDVLNVPDYAIRIMLKGQFSWRNPKLSQGNQLVTLVISCKDYSGEFFKDLQNSPNDPYLQSYLQDCSQATGIMVLIDGMALDRDPIYANSIEKFFVALDRIDLDETQRRLALVISKCEQPELWVKRHTPREMFHQRFRNTYARLDSLNKVGGVEVEYFAVSALGMLGRNYPGPNAQLISRDQGGVAATLKDPLRWRPFGLIAPIYWLCTGERHKKLDEE
jgi:hypothetical protein